MDCSHVEFCASKSRIDLDRVRSLFDAAAFWATGRCLDDLAVAIAHSNPVVTVWDGERLIGFARATSDGVYRACIWDVVIHPDYQGSGLGTKLVEAVLSHPHLHRVERVYLMTTHKQQFYKKIGFEENSTTTMVLYNRSVMELPLEESPQATGIEVW